MKKILVAVDGSPSSEKALEAAVKLAREGGGWLTAVAVLERGGDPRLERLAEGVRARASRHLQEVLAASANFAGARGVSLTPLFREGHPAEAILTCAEQEGAELVVLGAGREPAGPGLGGTADRVSDHCRCAVLLVK
jgi:nucleotide-binding universal stress UspA family protein